MKDFRQFLKTILALPLPKPKKIRFKRIIAVPSKIKPDDFLTENNKPFRFSREGAKRPIEKRSK